MQALERSNYLCTYSADGCPVRLDSRLALKLILGQAKLFRSLGL